MGHQRRAFWAWMGGVAGISASLAWGAAWGTQVIHPLHRSPDELVPLVRPLLDTAQGEEVQAFDRALLLRASPATLRQVQKLLAQLDRGRDTLQVRVKRGGGGQSEGSRQEIRGRGLRVSDRFGETHSESETSLQVTEGQPAQIFGQNGTAGEALAVTVRRAGEDGGTVEVVQGSLASTQVQGGRTVVRGRLGEWIEIGALGDGRSDRTRDLLSRGHASRQSSQSVRIRVER